LWGFSAWTTPSLAATNPLTPPGDINKILDLSRIYVVGKIIHRSFPSGQVWLEMGAKKLLVTPNIRGKHLSTPDENLYYVKCS
jgi:hypothetical protein